MLCVIRTSKPSIQRISISMLVFTYSMEYLHHHNYKWNSRHSTWTNYMVIISSTINLGHISQELQGIICLSKPPDKTSTKNRVPGLEGTSSYYVGGIYISTHLDAWCFLFCRWNYHAFQRSPYGQKNMTYKEKDYGLQTYALCQKGYTYQIFMCNFYTLSSMQSDNRLIPWL